MGMIDGMANRTRYKLNKLVKSELDKSRRTTLKQLREKRDSHIEGISAGFVVPSNRYDVLHDRMLKELEYVKKLEWLSLYFE